MRLMREDQSSMQSIAAGLKRRLPDSREMLTLFGFIIFMVASWSLYTFFFNLTSYLNHFNIFEILSVLSYLLGFALLESTSVTAALVLVSLVLPPGWFRDGFAYKGAATVLVSAIASIRLQHSVSIGNIPSLRSFAVGVLLVFMICLALIVLFQNVDRLRAIFLAVLAQFEIFVYIYVPLGVIGLAVVLARNIF